MYSSAEEHIDCFLFLTIMNKAAINMLSKCLCDKDEKSFGNMPKSGIARY